MKFVNSSDKTFICSALPRFTASFLNAALHLLHVHSITSVCFLRCFIRTHFSKHRVAFALFF